MAKDYSKIDQEILEAIQSYEGVPTAHNLSTPGGGPLKHDVHLLLDRLKKNPDLQKKLEIKGMQFVETCDRKTFDMCIITHQWGEAKGKTREVIDKRLDTYILEVIDSYEGVPTACNLSKRRGGKLKYSERITRERLKENSKLQHALEARGILFVETCDRKIFDECVTTLQWTQATGKTREVIDKRLETHILVAIQSYQGIPTMRSLSKTYAGPLEYSRTLIGERLKNNPELKQGLEARGIQFAETCDRKTFDESFSTMQWTQATGKTREAIDKRLDTFILETIQSFQGVSSSCNLSRANGGPMGYSHRFIGIRLKKNPKLQQALEARGIQFVETCDEKTFYECINTSRWVKTTKKTKEAINQRLDMYLFEAVQLYQGIPTAHGLSKTERRSLGCSHSIIGERLKKNPKLQQALEARGVQFVETCVMKTFDECVTTGQWRRATGKARDAIDIRIDTYILEAIQSYSGIPTSHNLSRAGGGLLEYSSRIIGERLKKNPDLRRALYLKRGLTEDRINALEIEQENSSPALVESVRRRLPNTRIFREALGILRQFREPFEGKKVLESSFYPVPLGRAAQMLGIRCNSLYARAHSIKRSDFRFELEGSFDSIAMLQFCHRLSQEALINAFNEVNRILVEGGVALISLPEEFSRTTIFETQIQDFGFELKTEGTLYTRTLALEELAAFGIADPERLKQKIEQATNIIQLVKTRPAIGKMLDEFVPPKPTSGNGEFVPSMGEIDTPENLLLELAAIFRSKRPGLDEAFILTVLDDIKYEESHVLGYNMNPKKPKSVEIYSKNGPILRNDELSALPAKILEPTFREKVLVRPGHETKIPARLVRNALLAK